MKEILVFDIENQGLNINITVISFIALTIVIPILARKIIIIRKKKSLRCQHVWFAMIFVIIYFSTSWSFFKHVQEYLYLINVRKSGEYQVVVGRVVNFEPATVFGKLGKFERFDIGVYSFSYNIRESGNSYHDPSYNTGPIENGVVARVFFTPKNKKIIRLSILKKSRDM